MTKYEELTQETGELSDNSSIMKINPKIIVLKVSEVKKVQQRYCVVNIVTAICIIAYTCYKMYVFCHACFGEIQ